MYCKECKKENPDNSNFCLHCGLNFKTGTKQRILIHPKVNIIGYRICNIIFFCLATIFSLCPWVKIFGESVSAFELIDLATISGSDEVMCLAILYLTIQALIVILSIIYIFRDITLKGTPENPGHITYAKVVSTAFVIVMALIFVFYIAMFNDIEIEHWDSMPIPFSKYFYFAFLSLCICRYLIIPDYIDGYYQNRRMDALDRKYNSWMFE